VLLVLAPAWAHTRRGLRRMHPALQECTASGARPLQQGQGQAQSSYRFPFLIIGSLIHIIRRCLDAPCPEFLTPPAVLHFFYITRHGLSGFPGDSCTNSSGIGKSLYQVQADKHASRGADWHSWHALPNRKPECPVSGHSGLCVPAKSGTRLRNCPRRSLLLSLPRLPSSPLREA
jgi:hypothetical protein